MIKRIQFTKMQQFVWSIIRIGTAFVLGLINTSTDKEWLRLISFFAALIIWGITFGMDMYKAGVEDGKAEERIYGAARTVSFMLKYFKRLEQNRPITKEEFKEMLDLEMKKDHPSLEPFE